MHKHLDTTAVLILIVLCASWGLQQVAIKVILPEVAPVLQAAIRSMGATVLLLLWMVLRGDRIVNRDGTLWWGIAAGLLFAFEFMFIYWGLTFTLASRSVIFIYLSPFVVAIGAQLFVPGEHLRKVQVLGLVGAFVGLVVAFGESLSLPDKTMLIGDAMLVLAAVLWGATTVLIKASPLATINASKTLLYQLGVSALVLPVGAWLLGESLPTSLSLLAIGSLVYQAVWIAFVTYLIWFWLVRHYPASRLASFTFLTPLFGVILANLILSEPLTGGLLVALVLVASGIYLVNRPDVGAVVAGKE
jgi:drug/metabolite transporter (DMT)-like permease